MERDHPKVYAAIRKVPILYLAFMWISEPRVYRLFQLGIYLGMGIAGFGSLLDPPDRFASTIGSNLGNILSLFVVFGAILGAVSVLPGIWWLERAGIISLVTGLAMFLVIVIASKSSIITTCILITFILSFVQRWFEIRGSALAPVEPVVPREE